MVLIPDAARGAIFGDFLEEIVVRVEEKGKARREIVDVQAAAQRPFDIFDAVAQREGELLNGRRAGLANVIAADGNGIELRRVLGAELDGVGDQAHAKARAGRCIPSARCIP